MARAANLVGETFLIKAQLVERAAARRRPNCAVASAMEKEWDPALHPRGGQNPGWFGPRVGTAASREANHNRHFAPAISATKSPIDARQIHSAKTTVRQVGFAEPSGLPEGTKENGYRGLGSWEFDSEQKALDFLEDLLPDSDRPPGWQAKVSKGCVGLNSLRCGDPLGKVIAEPFQNPYMQKNAETFKNIDAADERLAELQKENPGAEICAHGDADSGY